MSKPVTGQAETLAAAFLKALGSTADPMGANYIAARDDDLRDVVIDGIFDTVATMEAFIAVLDADGLIIVSRHGRAGAR